MVLGAIGMLMLRGLGLDSSYAGASSPAWSSWASAWVWCSPGDGHRDARRRAAATPASPRRRSTPRQQVGGSLGTALLSTLAASAATSVLAGHRPTPALVAHAAIHGYTTAFTVSAGVFAVAAVVAGLLFSRKEEQPAVVGEPVLAA